MSDCIVVFFHCVSTAVSMFHAWKDTGQHTMGSIFSCWVETFVLAPAAAGEESEIFKDH